MAEAREAEQAGESPPRRRAPGLGIAALAQDAAIYGGARVFLKSLSFLLVPLYAHFLVPAQFGILELVLATRAIVDVFISANMDAVFVRFYFDRDEPQWRRQITSLYLVIEAVYPAFLIGALMAFSGTLSDRILGVDDYASLFVIALAELYLTNVVDLPLILCRVRRKPVTFAVYSLSRGLVHVVFAALLVAVFHRGVQGILLAALISVVVALVISAREFVRDLTRKIDWSVGREMIAFAWPGIIGALAFYGLNLFDRFLVKSYHGLADSGLYGAAFRYSQIVLVAVFAFRLGWTSWHFSWLHTGRHQHMVARGANYYFFVTGFLAVFLSAWILPLFHLIMPSTYWEATTAIVPLALSTIAAGAYNVFGVSMMVTKRMRVLPALAVGASAIAIGLYFVLIPPFSFVGAAWATAAAFTALALGTAAVGQRIYRVPWDVGRIVLAAGLAAALSLTALLLDETMPLAASLPFRAGLTIAFPVALYLVGFFPASDVAAARAQLGRLRRR